MSYLILSSRLRRKIDYAIDILEFIESQLLRDAVRQELETLKSELVKFSNLLAKKENPLAENQMADAWKMLHENFLSHWQQMCTREELLDIVEQSNKLPINWLKVIEAEIKNVFESSAELDIEALRDIARQRLLEYELVEFGESMKHLFPSRPPSCFISYAWGNKTHEDQVHQIAYLLKYAGIEVLLDIWCNKVNSIPAFTELVNKEKSDFVVVIGTKLLRQKNNVEATGQGSWVHEELQQIGIRKARYPNDHGIIKLLLEGHADQAFPDFLQPLADDYTDFDLSQNYYEKFFNLLKLLYAKYSAIQEKLNNLRQTFQDEVVIINQTNQAELMQLMKLNTPVDYEKQQAEKANLFAKIKQASKLFSQFVERTFANELLYAEMLKNRLQDKYAENDKIERLFYPENPLPIANCYLHLALVVDKETKQQKAEVLDKSKKEEASIQRDYILRDYECVEHIQHKLEVHEILQECKTAIKQIFIEGAAGTGKSTLCQRIAYDWSQSKAPWQNYKWLFHIRLRDLKSAKAYTKDYLGKLLQECFRHGDKELDDWQLERVRKEMRDKPRQVLFILDGYDELQIDAITLNNLLEPLKEYDFIVTSRPGANFKTDLAKHHITKEQLLHLAILGFNDQQIEQYANRFFDPHYTPVNPPESPTNPKEVIQALANNPSLWSVSHIPIQLELLCSIWGDELKASDITLTNLYELMLNKLLVRLHVKFKRQHLGDLFDYDLRETYGSQIDYLAYLAYLGMKDNKIILEKRGYIEKALIDLRIPHPSQFFEDIKFLGVFKRSDDGRQGEFIHLTFQEFFAAKHWVELFSETATQTQAITLLTENRDHPRYQVMWWFVAGLLKENITLLEVFFANLLGETKQELLKQLLLANSYRLLLSLRCLDESANQDKLASIPQSEFLLPIIKSYVENILVEYARRRYLYDKSKYSILISNLKISLCLIDKLNINDLLQQEMENGYQQSRINIAKIVMDLGCKTLPIMDEILQALIKDASEDSFATAVQLSLWLVRKSPDLIKFLLNQLKSFNFYDRYLAAKQLIQLGEKRVEAIEALKQVLSLADAWDRYQAAALLIELGEEKAAVIKTLREDLNAENTWVRESAAELLIQLGEDKKGAIAALQQNLSAAYARDRYKAAELLIRLGEKNADVIKALQQNLYVSYARDRYAVAALLIELGENKAEAIAALQKNLSTADAEDRYAAAELLIDCGEKKKVLDILVEDLSSKNISNWYDTAELLIRLGEKKADVITALQQNLYAPYAKDRYAAAELLIQLGENKKGAIEALQQNLSAADPEDRYSAAELLIQLGENKKGAIEALQQNLSAAHPGDRYKAVALLIQLGEKKEEAMAVLQKDLSAADAGDHYRAIALLSELGEKRKEVIDALRKDLSAANAENVRIAAKWLIQLGEQEELAAKKLDIFNKAYKYRSLGNTSKLSGDLNQAISSYEQAIALLPEVECHHNLACCYYVNGEIDKAESTFKTAIKLNVDSGIYCEYGHFLYQQKRYQEAIVNLNKAMEMSKDHHELHYGQLEKIVIDSDLRQELECNNEISIQSEVLANYLLVRCYQALHQENEMKHALSTLIDMAKMNPNQLSYRLIGYIFQTLNEELQAKDYFAKAELLTKAKAQEKLITKTSSPFGKIPFFFPVSSTPFFHPATCSFSPAVTTFLHQTTSNAGQDQVQADQPPSALARGDQVEPNHTKANLK